MAKKVKGVMSCGLAGKTARSSARNLLSGLRVKKSQAQAALAHLKRCVFCQTRIKNQIADAKKGKKRKVYLDSLPETLRELTQLVG